MIWKGFKPCNCHLFRPASSVWKSKVGRWQTQVKLCVYLQASREYYRFSQVRLYHICFQDIVLQKYTLSFQSSEHVYIGGKFENAVIHLTTVYYNAKL